MAIKAFNAVFGVAVGNVGNVISSAGDINAANVTVTGISDLGSAANVKISGGLNNYYLKTDGSGNLSWAAVTASPAGSNTQIQFNDNGSLGGSANFTFNKTTNALTVSGNINGANANLGNSVSANYFIGDGGLLSNITVGSATSISNGNSNVVVTANSNVNISVSGNTNVVVATGDGLIVNGYVSGVGNITGGNLKTTGLITATGNISGGNIFGTGIISVAGNADFGNVQTTEVNSTTISASGNANVGNLVTPGNITSNLKITSQTLSVVGNANIGNIGVGIITATSSITGGNLITSGTLSVSGNSTLANLTVAGFLDLSGNIAANWVVSNVSQTGLLTATTGNITTINATTVNVNNNVVLQGGNLTGANVLAANTISATVVDASLLGGTIRASSNAQPNITSLGVLTSLSVSGTTNLGVLNASSASVTSNVTAGNVLSTGIISTTGNVSGLYIFGNGAFLTDVAAGSANVAQTVSFNAQPNITSVGTLTSLSVSGNINAGNLIGVFANGASNITIPTASGNILFAAGGNANVVVMKTDGNVGIGSNNPGYKLEVNGSFAATSKSFVIDHPTKKGYKLRYGSLESPYHGVRITGEAAVVDGVCKVKLPTYIKALVKQEGSQVQITPIKHGKVLWVDEINVAKNYFKIAMEKDSKYEGVEFKFYWSFTAIRKDIEDMIVEFSV